jgi:hypothetical protein
VVNFGQRRRRPAAVAQAHRDGASERGRKGLRVGMGAVTNGEAIGSFYRCGGGEMRHQEGLQCQQ